MSHISVHFGRGLWRLGFHRRRGLLSTPWAASNVWLEWSFQSGCQLPWWVVVKTLLWKKPTDQLENVPSLPRLSSRGSQNVARTNSISITRDLFTNANLRFYPRPTESETLGCGPAICVLTNHPRDSDTHSCMRSMALGHQIIFSHLWAWSCLPVLLTSSTSSSLSISLKMFISSMGLFCLSFPVSIVFPKDPRFFGISTTWNHITQRLSSSLQTQSWTFLEL